MAEFVTVAKAGDVPDGEMRAFEVGDRVVAIANIGGDLWGFDDVCTHRMCSLAEGDLEDDVVICACHGSEYDVTSGEVLGGPAPEDIDTFEVRVEGGEIQVQV
jgi:3-phenylpropionate/trans-cinnamate dioxygenase ferredoxin component